MFHSIDAPLTNQHLNDKFKSPFALLASAIKRARETVGSGHELPVGSKILNPAYHILEEIDDEMDDLPCTSCSKGAK